jgi:hypothetical protein
MGAQRAPAWLRGAAAAGARAFDRIYFTGQRTFNNKMFLFITRSCKWA